jgi:hypothetical protein
MEFEHFGLSRDLLYLCSLLLGVAAAIFYITTRKDCSLRKRSILITVILCLSACIVALLAASVILSKGMIFGVALIYPLMVLFFILGGIGFYFPRAGGCTIIFAGGLFAVFICFFFLSFPAFKEPRSLSVRATENELLFRREADTWNIRDDGNTIRFEAVSITANPAYPVIGGERRGLITRVTRNNIELFTLGGKFRRLAGDSLGFLREKTTIDLPVELMSPGISISVLFNGKQLYFDPPIRL